MKRKASRHATPNRGLSILAFMKQVGLALAPETVHWDIGAFSLGAKELSTLQLRISFTELAVDELAAHSTVFGPISLSFDIAKLRGTGATPVIYVPQGITDSPLSQICRWLTRAALDTLRNKPVGRRNRLPHVYFLL